jgi:ribosomal protein L22
MTEKNYAPDMKQKMKPVKENSIPYKHEEKKIDDKKLDAEIEKVQEKIEEQVKEEKQEEKAKQEEKKEAKKEIKKKEIAEVNAHDVGISAKHSAAICDMIRNKNPDEGIWKLEMALKKKFAIPMKGEIPHRKGNIMAGRYCFKASEAFIKLLKSLKANASVNGMNSDKLVVSEARANIAARPFRRFGKGRMKRTHVHLKAREAGK